MQISWATSASRLAAASTMVAAWTPRRNPAVDARTSIERPAMRRSTRRRASTGSSAGRALPSGYGVSIPERASSAIRLMIVDASSAWTVWPMNAMNSPKATIARRTATTTEMSGT